MKNEFDSKSTADDVLAGVDLTGKRYLITGAASGIGKETARSLAARGASIVGTTRSDVDLASLASVRRFADQLLAEGKPFDAIIANAGVMATPFGKTVDGFETQLATNYLGHFALVTRIAPLLAKNGRLVVLSSMAHRVADVDLDDPSFEKQPYDAFVAYGRSKTADTLFAVEFDRRHRDRGIRAAAVMPGNSLTSLPRHFSEQELQGVLATVSKARADAGLPPAELKTIPQAAATSVWAAVVANADAIGGKYLEDCAVASVDDTPNPFADGVRSYALDPARASELWSKTETWLSR